MSNKFEVDFRLKKPIPDNHIISGIGFNGETITHIYTDAIAENRPKYSTIPILHIIKTNDAMNELAPADEPDEKMLFPPGFTLRSIKYVIKDNQVTIHAWIEDPVSKKTKRSSVSITPKNINAEFVHYMNECVDSINAIASVNLATNSIDSIEGFTAGQKSERTDYGTESYVSGIDRKYSDHIIKDPTMMCPTMRPTTVEPVVDSYLTNREIFMILIILIVICIAMYNFVGSKDVEKIKADADNALNSAINS